MEIPPRSRVEMSVELAYKSATPANLFKEEDHPRNEDGEFAKKGTGVAKKADKVPAKAPAKPAKNEHAETADFFGVKPEQRNLYQEDVVKPGWVGDMPQEAAKPLYEPKKVREYSDQEKAEREQVRIFEEVMQDPTKASQRDLVISRGYLGLMMAYDKRRHAKGQITKQQLDDSLDSYQREADFVDQLIRDGLNGKRKGPEDQTRAEKIAEIVVNENRNVFQVAKEMGLTLDELRDERAEIDRHIAERRELEKPSPSPERARAMEKAKAMQAKDPIPPRERVTAAP